MEVAGQPHLVRFRYCRDHIKINRALKIKVVYICIYFKIL